MATPTPANTSATKTAGTPDTPVEAKSDISCLPADVTKERETDEPDELEDFDEIDEPEEFEGVEEFDEPDGFEGVEGVDGVDGLDGFDGAEGPDGRDGFDGSDGVEGSDGLTGSAFFVHCATNVTTPSASAVRFDTSALSSYVSARESADSVDTLFFTFQPANV